jgi:hypothetical protein
VAQDNGASYKGVTTAVHSRRLDLGSCFKGVPLRRSLRICNTAQLPCSFSIDLWQQMADGRLVPVPSPRVGMHGAVVSALIQEPGPAAGSGRVPGGSSSSAAAGGSGGNASDAARECFASGLGRSSCFRGVGVLGVSVAPRAGALEAGQTAKLQVSIDPTIEGPVRLFGVVRVVGMDKPRGFALSCLVKGLKVGYQLFDTATWEAAGRPGMQGGRCWVSALPSAMESCGSASAHPAGSEEGPATAVSGRSSSECAGDGDSGALEGEAGVVAVDFGVCQLGQPARRILVLTNATTMAAEVVAWVERHPAAAAQAPLRWTVHNTAQPLPGSHAGHAELLPLHAPASDGGQQPAAATASDSRAGSAPAFPSGSASACHDRLLLQHAVVCSRSSSGPTAPQIQGRPRGVPASAAAASSMLGPSSMAGSGRHSPSGGRPAASSSPASRRQPLITLSPELTRLTPFAAVGGSAGNAMMLARRVQQEAAAALGLACSSAGSPSSSRGGGSTAGLLVAQPGLALALAPHGGVLAPDSTIAVELVAFSAMPGTYCDMLTVQVRRTGPGAVSWVSFVNCMCLGMSSTSA